MEDVRERWQKSLPEKVKMWPKMQYSATEIYIPQFARPFFKYSVKY